MTAWSPSVVMVGAAPVQIWSGVAGAPLVSLTNQDQANDVWVSYNRSVAAGGTDAVDIPPLGNVSLNGTESIYAVAAVDGAGPVQVNPGGGNTNPSPVQIATQIAPLAAAIAQQIAATGIPIIPAPTVIYNQ